MLDTHACDPILQHIPTLLLLLIRRSGVLQTFPEILEKNSIILFYINQFLYEWPSWWHVHKESLRVSAGFEKLLIFYLAIYSILHLCKQGLGYGHLLLRPTVLLILSSVYVPPNASSPWKNWMPLLESNSVSRWRLYCCWQFQSSIWGLSSPNTIKMSLVIWEETTSWIMFTPMLQKPSEPLSFHTLGNLITCLCFYSPSTPSSSSSSVWSPQWRL